MEPPGQSAENDRPEPISAARIAACLRKLKPLFLEGVGGRGEHITLAALLLENTIAAYEEADGAVWSNVDPPSMRREQLKKLIRPARANADPESLPDADQAGFGVRIPEEQGDTTKADPFKGGGGGIAARVAMRLPWSHPCEELGARVVIHGPKEFGRDGKREFRKYRLTVSLEQLGIDEQPAPGPAVASPFVTFVGRVEEIQRALEAIEKGKTVSIVGPPGIGKTQLARVIVKRLQGRFIDTIEVRSSGDPKAHALEAVLYEAIRRLANRRQQPTAIMPRSSVEALTTAYLDALAVGPTLILFDDVRGDWTLETLRPPIGSATVFTSQDAADLPDAEIIRLSELPDSEARTLLTTIAPRSTVPLPDRLRQQLLRGDTGIPMHLKPDADSADAIVRLCGGHPLAIETAGFTIRDRTDLAVTEYVSGLLSEITRLKALGMRLSESRIEATFRRAYELLQPETRRVFRALSVFPYDFTRRAASLICDDPDAAQIGELRRRNLLASFDVEQRYHMLDLVRIFAALQIDEVEKAAVERRFALHYAQYVRRVHWLRDRTAIDSNIIQLSAMPLEEDRENLVKSIRWSHMHDGDLAGNFVSVFLSPVIHEVFPRYAYDDPEEEETRWLFKARDAALRNNDLDPIVGVSVLVVIAFVLAELGRFADALAAAEDALARSSGLPSDFSRPAYLALRQAYRLGKLERARQLAVICRKHRPPDTTSCVIILMISALLALQESRHQAARKYCHEALRRLRSEGATLLEPYVLNLLGDVEFDRRAFAAARKAYERAYAIRRAPMNWFAQLLHRKRPDLPAGADLAVILALCNELEVEFDGLEVSLALETDEGPWMPELHSMVRLARIDAREERRRTEASQSFRCILHLLTKAGGRVGTCIELALGLAEIGEWRDAIACLGFSIEGGQPRVQAQAHLACGMILEQRGYVSAAVRHYRAATAVSPIPEWPFRIVAAEGIKRSRGQRGKSFRPGRRSPAVCTLPHDHMRRIDESELARVIRDSEPRHEEVVMVADGRITINLPDGFGNDPPTPSA